jgi:hypothetical protein
MDVRKSEGTVAFTAQTYLGSMSFVDLCERRERCGAAMYHT